MHYSKCARKFHKVIRYKLVRCSRIVLVVEKYTGVVKERRFK